MSADFEAIVKLCRLAVRYELQGASLRVEVANSPEVHRLVADAAAYRQADFYIGAQQQHRTLSTIPAGTEIELRFEGLTSNQKVFSQCLVSLLSYQQGLFLSNAPPEYFLLEEQYATGDAHVPDTVQAYQRIPKLCELIRSVADVVLDDGTPSPTFVVLGGKRMDIGVNYNISALMAFPAATSIEALAVELQGPPFVDAKKSLFKKVIVRLLETVPQERRFTELVKRFDVARQLFAADFDLYSTEFNFEKVRESFEQKRLAFVLQLNNTTSDLLGKMLAIPIGQGLIVSQLKSDPAASVGNMALMLGSFVFAAFAVLLIVNQQQSLKQIKAEIEMENEVLERRFPQLYQRVEEMFKALRRRASLHTWAFPVVVLTLLIATTAYSGYAFLRVPPGTYWVGNEAPATALGRTSPPPTENSAVVQMVVAPQRAATTPAPNNRDTHNLPRCPDREHWHRQRVKVGLSPRAVAGIYASRRNKRAAFDECADDFQQTHTILPRRTRFVAMCCRVESGRLRS